MSKINFDRGAALGCALFAAVLAQNASANVGEIYGYGSRNAALAGATGAWSEDGFAAFTNPAALGLVDNRTVHLTVGVLLMEPRFTAIGNVVIDNTYTSDETVPRFGNGDTDYRTTFGQVVGLAVKISDAPRIGL